MSKLIDLVKRRFGSLTVISRSDKKVGNKLYWWCRCDCGETKEIEGNSLRGGDTKSCGCSRYLVASQKRIKYGDQPAANIPEYRIWGGMKTRCNNPRRKHYKDYGGRGIRVCRRWNDSFEAFYADMGPMPDNPGARYTVEREKTDGNYSCGKCEDCSANGWPMNCHWATYEEQALNKRNNRLLTFNGETKTSKEWAEIVGMSRGTIESRIDRQGWTVERALTTPPLTAYERGKAAAASSKPGRTRFLTFRGETLTMREWAKRLGISRKMIQTRLNSFGWSVEQTLSTPIRKKKPRETPLKQAELF